MTENSRASDAERRLADIEHIAGILRRQAWLIALCVLVAGAGALGLSVVKQKQYSASASLLFRNPGFAEDLFGSGSAAVTGDPRREAATNEKLVGLDVVGKRAARRLEGLSPDEVSDMVSVSAEGESDVVSVTASSPNPAEAKLVANTFARQFIAFRAETDRSKLLQAKRLAERELDRLSPSERAGPRGKALSQGVEKLGILASLQTGNAELVQPAELPDSPSSPKPVRNAALGAVLGLILGVGLAFLLERLNRRLRDPEEAREAFGLPVLGTVPESKALTADGGKAAAEPGFAENEAFRMLRAALRYFNVDRDVRTVLITADGAGMGKSTVAWNLARVAASSCKAIVVETDLRNPALSRQHGLPAGPGLAELLTHQIELDDAIQSQPLDAGGDGAGATAPDAIVAGMLPPNPAALIESQAMTEVLSRLAERYDLVVIDTAPVGVVSDAFPLARQVDGVVFVARMGQSTRDGAAWMRERFERLGAPVLGIVANAVKVRRGGKYGYGNYGGYYGPANPAGADRKGAAAVLDRA